MTRRSLLPREHGAYFQLGVPLIISYLRCAANLAMVELTAAAALAFLANEPLLVVAMLGVARWPPAARRSADRCDRNGWQMYRKRCSAHRLSQRRADSVVIA